MQLRLAAVGDNKDKEEGWEEGDNDGMALLSSFSFHTMTVWRRERGRNHTRTSKDKIGHRPTRIPRTIGRRRTTKHHRPLLQQQTRGAHG